MKADFISKITVGNQSLESQLSSASTLACTANSALPGQGKNCQLLVCFFES